MSFIPRINVIFYRKYQAAPSSYMVQFIVAWRRKMDNKKIKNKIKTWKRSDHSLSRNCGMQTNEGGVGEGYDYANDA